MMSFTFCKLFQLEIGTSDLRVAVKIPFVWSTWRLQRLVSGIYMNDHLAPHSSFFRRFCTHKGFHIFVGGPRCKT